MLARGSCLEPDERTLLILGAPIVNHRLWRTPWLSYNKVFLKVCFYDLI